MRVRVRVRVREVAIRAGRVVLERGEAGALERQVGRTAEAGAERPDRVHPHGRDADVRLHQRDAVRGPMVTQHVQPRHGDGQRRLLVHRVGVRVRVRVG